MYYFFREDHVLSFFSIFPLSSHESGRWMNVLQRLTICLSSPCLCFLICKLIKIKSEHKMVFKKFKWNNLHWECAKMLMHSFTKPHNHCHPFRSSDCFPHGCPHSLLQNYKHKEDLCINISAFCKSSINHNVLIFSLWTSFYIISLLKEWMSQKGFISFIRIIELN